MTLDLRYFQSANELAGLYWKTPIAPIRAGLLHALPSVHADRTQMSIQDHLDELTIKLSLPQQQAREIAEACKDADPDVADPRIGLSRTAIKFALTTITNQRRNCHPRLQDYNPDDSLSVAKHACITEHEKSMIDLLLMPYVQRRIFGHRVLQEPTKNFLELLFDRGVPSDQALKVVYHLELFDLRLPKNEVGEKEKFAAMKHVVHARAKSAFLFEEHLARLVGEGDRVAEACLALGVKLGEFQLSLPA